MESETSNPQILPLQLVTSKHPEGFSGGSAVKNLPVNAGDAGSIPWVGKIPGGGNGNALQYSCLGNSMNRGAWWATVHGITESRTGLSTHQSIREEPKPDSSNFCFFYLHFQCTILLI